MADFELLAENLLLALDIRFERGDRCKRAILAAFRVIHNASHAEAIERACSAVESKLVKQSIIVPGSVPPKQMPWQEMDWNVSLKEAVAAIRAAAKSRIRRTQAAKRKRKS